MLSRLCCQCWKISICCITNNTHIKNNKIITKSLLGTTNKLDALRLFFCKESHTVRGNFTSRFACHALGKDAHM